MIVGNLSNTKEIEKLNKHLPAVFEWLRNNADSIHNSDITRIDLIDGEVYANIESVALKERTEQLIEAHKKYIDVHVPVNTTEVIGWESADALDCPVSPYDEEKDVAKFCKIPDTYLYIKPGYFCIMTPDDGHAPCIGSGQLKKICVKIKI
ncbi:MAG: YhcH/YjgK/YiaL family protein [Muribaculaceae bacterium]|nr:YhcH/YjgK/YiaL family protein [Muribaculaceae bacterium]